jgi:glycosyltransferase involved in cell wall biosynthesis
LRAYHTLRWVTFARRSTGDFDLRFSPSQFDDLERDLRSCLKGKFCLYQGHLAVRHSKRSGVTARISPRQMADVSGNRHERLACMAAADAVHVLNNGFSASLPEFLRERATIISNPADPPASVDWERENAPRKTILAAGRLEDGHKQFSLLIEAFAMLSRVFPEWDVRICGDGAYRRNYENLIADLGLEQRVHLAGRVDDMDAEYAPAYLVCVPSRYEGFGLVTVERQRYALPAVGFAQCPGVNEVIVHGENGILAPEMSAQSLAAGLRVLMKNAAARRQMGERGQELLARYAPEKIYGQWVKLLAATAERKNRTRLNYREPSERERAELALREILCRPAPFARPGYEDHQRELLRQHLLLDQR